MVDYSNVFKYNPIPTLIFEEDSLQIVDVNESVLELYGYSKKEILDKTFLDLSTKDESKEVLKSLDLALYSSDRTNLGVFTHLKTNGKSLRIEITCNKVQFMNKDCVVAICRDVTIEEKETRKALETENIMAASQDVIASIDEEGNFIHVSSASETLWGYSPDELVGVPYINLVHPEDIERTNQAAADIISGEKPTNFENRYIKKNGGTAYNLWSAHWDDESKIMYVIARDATEKKKEAQILIESESRFKALVQEGSDLIAILDENANYKYVSPTSTAVLGFSPDELINRSPFEFIHPDDTNKVKESLSKTATQNRVQIAPFRFLNKDGEWRWIETVLTNLTDHPSIKGIVANSRDITSIKEEEHRLRLLESVVMNTRDAIIVTEAEPQQEPGPRILFVNPAFTEMTGYSSEEVLGKSPRFLQGPKSDKEALKKLGESMKRWEPSELTTINYKKNGEEFWLNFKINPVADDKGWYTHWISIERDVTEEKNEEIQKKLFSLISENFKSDANLYDCLYGLCEIIGKFDSFDFCEIWLPSLTNEKLRLYSKYAKDETGSLFYKLSNSVNEFYFGEGLPGTVWKKNTIEIWNDISKDSRFVRSKAAVKSGINAVMGLPLKHDNSIIGVLVMGTRYEKSELFRSNLILEEMKEYIGSEINRKKLEEDLKYLFEALPNIVGTSDFNGEIIKVNKAGCELLEYQEDELIEKSIFDIIHPDDLPTTDKTFAKLKEGETVYNFENRVITKSGKILWLRWQCSSNKNEEVIFATATDITEEKKLKQLNDEASHLATIGGWEFDLINNNASWSDIIYQIFEVDPEEFTPELDKSIAFYRSDFRGMIEEKIEEAKSVESSFNFEAILVTAKGKEKWTRAIVRSEFVEGRCVRLYGSLQDIDERKRLDEKLHEVLNSITDGFYTLDENWNFSYFNREAERLLNKKSQEVIGKNVWEIFPEDKGTKLETNYRTVASTHVAQSFEYLSPHDNSWYEINTYPSNGGITSYFKNIDEKKKASEELRKAYLEKDQILESIGDGFFALDNDWIVTYWNRAAEEMLPMKRGEILGKNFWNVYKDIVDTNFFRKYNEAKQTGKVVTFEERYSTLDLWFEVRVYPSENGLSVFFKDITQRKKAELKILQANERFEKVAQATSDAIWDWDIENDIFYRGKGFSELFGYDVKKMLQEKEFWQDTFHKDDLPIIKESLEKALKDVNKDNWELEYRIVKPSKEIKTVIDKGVIIRDDSGKAIRMVGAITDITETRRHEIELKTLNEELRKHAADLELSNEQLEQFAYIASHDLQEPLRMISSFLTQLKRKYADELDDRALQYIYFATDGAKRMKQIILDLLEYSRAGKVMYKTEKIDLNQLIEEYRSLRKKLIEESNAIIKIESLPVIVGQVAPLTQVIHSLIDNAIKYRKPKEAPLVEISVSEDDRFWIFKVKDYGIGIDSQFFDKIFVLFQRLHNRNEYGGTGIGLSVAKKNIESWGGRIWLESNLDQGSTFYFTVPKS